MRFEAIPPRHYLYGVSGFRARRFLWAFGKFQCAPDDWIGDKEALRREGYASGAFHGVPGADALPQEIRVEVPPEPRPVFGERDTVGGT